MSKQEGTVVIVGAGLAGLYAAQLLSSVVPRVVVVEASGEVGGRVKEIGGLVPWPLQLGPEFIHGSENSVLMRMINKYGWGTKELEWPDRYYFADDKTCCGGENETEDVAWVHDFFDGILEAEGAEGESVRDVLVRSGATERQIEIAEVCYANDFGASLKRMGLPELKQEKLRWNYGEKYLLLDRPLSRLVERLAAGTDVRLGWEARAIRYEASVEAGANLAPGAAGTCGGPGRRCQVVDREGRSIDCDAVVVTVPHRILQDGDIDFEPPLPPDKLGAISRVSMSTAVKVFLIFRHRFWPESFWDACCPFGFLPEVWATEYDSQGRAETGAAGGAAIVGFACAERAERIAAMPEEEVVRASLAQLDEMFASRVDPKPATSAFESCHVKDWSKEPHIRGAYTFPGRGAREGDRGLLGRPLGSLFFAGEATHEGVNPCMQGALETGERAAREVLRTFRVRAERHQTKL